MSIRSMLRRGVRAVAAPLIDRARLSARLPLASREEVEMIRGVRPYTMTSPEKMWGVIEAVRYVVANRIPGDFVECGVWRGGSAILAALAFEAAGDQRPLWLFDTFEGMTEPGPLDVAYDGQSAIAKYAALRDGACADWCRASLPEVRANLESVVACDARYVAGPVEQTLRNPGFDLPETIAILRLDTDWYQSTKVELEVLYPQLSPGGVLILDDYSWWQGVTKAVDEYFGGPPAMIQMDQGGWLMVKPRLADQRSPAMRHPLDNGAHVFGGPA